MPFGFTENDAKRIGRAVRLVERDPTKVRLGGTDDNGAAPGVRLLIGKVQQTNAWSSATTAVVLVHTGDVGSVQSALTVVAYNQFLSFDSPGHTNRWVALANNGWGWQAIASDAPTFRIGTFSGSWSTSSTKVVTFKYQTNSPNTVVVNNLFANISVECGTRDCAISREGTAWFLVSAQCS